MSTAVHPTELIFIQVRWRGRCSMRGRLSGRDKEAVSVEQKASTQRFSALAAVCEAAPQEVTAWLHTLRMTTDVANHVPRSLPVAQDSRTPAPCQL